MATTTTNNGWDIPQSSDYVKQGADAIATLGQDIDTAVGTGLLAWTAYTPTFTNLTLNNGTIDFKYAQLGKNVFVRGTLTWGSTTSATASGLVISTPVTASTASGSPVVGSARYNDTGTENYIGTVGLSGAGSFAFNIVNASATYAVLRAITNSIPMTWVSTDQVLFYAMYQAA
jgi:hypothetical protein